MKNSIKKLNMLNSIVCTINNMWLNEGGGVEPKECGGMISLKLQLKGSRCWELGMRLHKKTVWKFIKKKKELLKGERTECKNYRGLLNMVEKIYTRILLDRICIMTVLFKSILGGMDELDAWIPEQDI